VNAPVKDELTLLERHEAIDGGAALAPPEHDLELRGEQQLEALLAFDRALATGNSPSANTAEGPYLEAVHECQRLLEAIWPRIVVAGDAIPTRFGRYLIIRELGRGAFGVVFLASDTVLGRKVALKVPRPLALETPEIRRRFVREAEAASRLDHPHIVPVYDVGEEGPICYIASAYCDGLTLAEWLRQQSAPVPFLEAARLVAILSAAVDHAHQREILHRDLKPSNILLQRRDPSASGNGEASFGPGFFPRICDFGLAKLLDQDSHDTRSGVPIGSPTYMAPEQAAGRLRDHGPSTDVYALGVILYELLTGKPPLRGETDLETLRLVADQDPPAPRNMRPGLPRDLNTICLKCLEKRPKERYLSAVNLAEDLQRFLAGKPVHARPVRPLQQVGKWAKRRPVHAALACVSALAVSVVVGVLSWSGAQLRQHREAIAKAERVAHFERSAQGARIEHAVAEERGRSDVRRGLAVKVKLVHDTFLSGQITLAASLAAELCSSPGLPEARGFALGYLRQLFRPDVTLLGESVPFNAPAVVRLAISPDSQTFATGMSDGGVVLWDLKQNRVLRSLDRRPYRAGNEVYHLGYSPDGRFLAFGNTNNEIKLWNVRSGEELGTLPELPERLAPQAEAIFTVRFTDSSDYLVTFRRSMPAKSIYVSFWSVPKRDGRPAHVATLNQNQLPKYGAKAPLEGSFGAGGSVESSPWLAYARDHLVLLDDGASLAIKEEASGVTLYDRSGLRTAQIYGPLGIPALVDRPLVGLTQDAIAWWSERARNLAGSADNGDRRSFGPCSIPSFSPDGRTLAYFDVPLGAILKDVASGRVHQTYATDPNWRIVDLGYTPDGRFLVMAGFHPQVHVLRIRPDVIGAHEKEVWSLAFSPDGATLASASDDHTVKLWNLDVARERATLHGHGKLVTAVAYSPDGSLLASASFDQTIRISDATTGDHVSTLSGHTDLVRALAFSPDGRTLASAGNDREVRLWNVKGRYEYSRPLTGHKEPVFSLVFSPDGETLFTGSLDKTIRLWDLRSGRAAAILGAEDQVYALAISLDGLTLAAAHPGGKVALWDVDRKESRSVLRGHSGDVLGLAFSPDGLTLASTGRDKMVCLWDPVTAQQLMTLPGHEAAVAAVAFSPDGAILTTGSHDGKIRLWRAAATDQKKSTLKK
jgi:eukaryotic-like serine/threonine-protein kinase